MQTELQEFSRYWERETDGTLALMRALPPDQYEFRPDAGGRSIGELAWHLAEVDAYVSLGIERGLTTVRLGAKRGRREMCIRQQREHRGTRLDVGIVVSRALLGLTGVRERNALGHPAFFVGKRIFALLFGDTLVLRLPEERVRQLTHHDGMQVFVHFDGDRERSEWIGIRHDDAEDYANHLELFREATAFARKGGLEASYLCGFKHTD
jgi:DinB family